MKKYRVALYQNGVECKSPWGTTNAKKILNKSFPNVGEAMNAAIAVKELLEDAGWDFVYYAYTVGIIRKEM